MMTQKRIFDRDRRPATAAEIRVITGPMDEVILRAILHTGATPLEVERALENLEEDNMTKAIFSREMDERVRNVYEILDYERNFFNGKSHKK